MIIDSHVHLLPKNVRSDRNCFCDTDPAFCALYSSEKAKLASEQDIISYLDDSCIDQAVVFGFPWEDHNQVSRNNDEIWDFHSKYPDRIIPFAVLSTLGGDKAHKETERTLKAGFYGIGELAMYHGGWSLADFEALSPSLELAELAEAPVIIHVNEPVGHDYPGKIPVDFRGLLRLIKANPDVDFILAHFGGGVFIYKLMPEIEKIMARTYIDTAASPYLYDPKVFEIACRTIGFDKILFGSDYPLLPLSRYIKQMKAAQLEPKFEAAILGENASGLLEKRRKGLVKAKRNFDTNAFHSRSL
jgi:uncharacterized protein